MTSGRFITFEGGEGTGKSTQVNRLVDFLRSRGIEALATREPGGPPGAEAIRALWLHTPPEPWDPLTEVLLVMAARREHLVKTIWPALRRGVWVISDRFADSTLVYQGAGLGLDDDLIRRLYRDVAGDSAPDLTILLDAPVDVGLARMSARRGPDDRYQQQDVVFHETLRAAYLRLALAEPTRFRIVEASGDADSVAQAVRTILESDVRWTMA